MISITLLALFAIMIFQQQGNGKWTSWYGGQESYIIKLPSLNPSQDTLEIISKSANVTIDKAMYGYLQADGDVSEAIKLLKELPPSDYKVYSKTP